MYYNFLRFFRTISLLTALALFFFTQTSSAKKLPDFMQFPAYIKSSTYRMLGTRDIEFTWGTENLWLSEIFQTWGRKGTEILWQQLEHDQRVKLIESFGSDKDGRKFYFDARIEAEMEELLKKEVNWVAIRDKDLILWLPVEARDALAVIGDYRYLEPIINGINITGLSLFKEYAYIARVLRQETAGLKEIAFRIARLDFVDKSPIMQNATEAAISVILESLINNLVTDAKLKDLSPVAQTAVEFSIDLLKRVNENPSFNAYEKNTTQLRAYYTRIMHDEITTAQRLLATLKQVEGKILAKVQEFSVSINTHTTAMQKFREHAGTIHTDFIKLAAHYRSQNLSGRISLMPQLHEKKEELQQVLKKAENLQAGVIEEVENVLVPGDPSSAKRLLANLRTPLDEMYLIMREISSEIEILSQAGGEIGLLKTEANLLKQKLDAHKKSADDYFEFFHTAVLRQGLPAFDPGDRSGALVGRPGMPEVSAALAYSFQQVLRLHDETQVLTKVYRELDSLISNYKTEDMETPSQRNDMNDTAEILQSIQRNYIDPPYFGMLLMNMRENLRLFAIDENDLLDMVRGRTPGINPVFIETIEGQGWVPASP